MANFWADACSEAFNEPLAAKLEGSYASCGTTVSVVAFCAIGCSAASAYSCFFCFCFVVVVVFASVNSD